MSTDITRKAFIQGTAVAAASMAVAGVASAAEGVAADGVYTTSALGRGGWFNVTTTITNGKIAAVEVAADHLETALIADACMGPTAEAMVANNSYTVDIMAGCTLTVCAMMNAVEAAIVEAGGNPDAYDNCPDTVVPADEVIDCDVVVIGGGTSGATAASKAGADGAKVVLLEKSSFVGGCCLHSSGPAVYGTKGQIEDGEDTATLIRTKFNNWLDYQHYRVDAGLLYTYLSNAGRAVDFVNQEGILCPNAPKAFRMVAYAERPQVFEHLLANGGVDVRYGVTAKSLIQDAAGAVVGVNAVTRQGSKLTVNAKTVIIASGGYGGDVERVWKTSAVHAVCGGFECNRGEGIDMAYAVGAAVPANTSGLQLHQTLATAQLRGWDYFHTRMPMILCYSPSIMHVDKAGIRYRNEYMIRSATAAAGGSAFTGDSTYVLVAQSTIDQLESGGMVAMGTDYTPGLPPLYKPQFDQNTLWTDVNAVLDQVVEGGWGYKGETIEELAENAGFEVDKFVETFNTYQKYCEQGLDEYFDKPAQYLVKYEYGPYYLVESTYNQLGTVCGLVVNNNMQVLDDRKRAIPGLLAVGADASSTLYDRMYSGNGDALAWCMTSGFLAGEFAAANL